MMRFAFLVHPLGRRDYLRSLPPGVAVPWLLRSRVARWLAVYAFPRRLYPYLKARVGPQRVFEFRRLASAEGAAVRGEVVSIPFNAGELVADQQRAVTLIRETCWRLAAEGTDIVGLGGINGVVGSYGRAVAEASPVPVTTGASYTAFVALETLALLARILGRSVAGLPVNLVGLPGRNALVLAELLVRRGADLGIVADAGAPHVGRFLAGLRGRTSIRVIPPDRIYEGLRPGEIVMAASSTGRQLDARRLAPGSIVIDVSLPRDVIPARPRRRDVVVVDGEVVRLPRASASEKDFFGCGEQHVLACFAEPCILAMASRCEPFTIGRRIDPARVEEIGMLGRRHGFRIDRLHAFGRPVSDDAVVAVGRIGVGGGGARRARLRVRGAGAEARPLLRHVRLPAP